MSSEPSADAPGAGTEPCVSPTKEWSADQSQQNSCADTATCMWPVKVWNADQSQKKSLVVTPRCKLSEFLSRGMHDALAWRHIVQCEAKNCTILFCNNFVKSFYI